MSRLAEALERAGQAPPPSPDATEPEVSISAEAELEAEAAAEPVTAREPIPTPDSAVASMAVFNGFDSKVAERLVVTETVSLMSLEQYRNLAATLHHAQVDRGIKVVMVASALGGEG